uniref:Uncharacterized protein n=1 Tax=Plectus sambesii TaxID=2011161 RepID=A0A914VR71_9BILA
GRTSGVLKKRSQSEIKPNTEVVRTSKSPRFLRGQLKQISGYSTHSDTFVPLLETASKSPDSVVADESSLSEEEHQLTT